MNKYIVIFTVLFMVVCSCVIVKPNLAELSSKQETTTVLSYSTGQGQIASKLKLNSPSQFCFNNDGTVIGEKVIIENFDKSVSILIDKLGVNVLTSENLNSILVITGISKLVSYKTPNQTHNIVIQKVGNKVIIASPNIF